MTVTVTAVTHPIVIFPIAVDEAGPMNEVEQGFLSILNMSVHIC